jgi:hypothetical protein
MALVFYSAESRARVFVTTRDKKQKGIVVFNVFLFESFLKNIVILVEERKKNGTKSMGRIL